MLQAVYDNIQWVFIAGDLVVVDTLLQDGSQVFRVGGGKSVLIESNNHNSVLLIPHSSEGR